jgi:hypothetical protein
MTMQTTFIILVIAMLAWIVIVEIETLELTFPADRVVKSGIASVAALLSVVAVILAIGLP